MTLDVLGNTLKEDFNIRFPGQYFNEETGLHYNRFRYYDAGIGRYVSADPIGQYGVLSLLDLSFVQGPFAGRAQRSIPGIVGVVGINVYDYTVGNPTNRIDPTGTAFNLVTGAFGAGVGGLVNGALVAAQGGSFGRGFLTGAAAGAVAGFTLNPFAAGAIIGGLNTSLNLAAGNQQSCNPLAAVAFGTALGFVGGGVGAQLGAAAAPSTASVVGFSQVGSAAGATFTSAGAQAAHTFVSGFGGI